MKKRRTFDREFKQMVIELSNNREDISGLASELDIRADLIYRWKREAMTHKNASFPGQGNKILTEEQKEIARLKKELYDIIANHSGQTYEKVWADSDRDYWMTAEEAKAYGMVDEVLIKSK